MPLRRAWQSTGRHSLHARLFNPAAQHERFYRNRGALRIYGGSHILTQSAAHQSVFANNTTQNRKHYFRCVHQAGLTRLVEYDFCC
jgi:hypothetical protein